MKGFLRTLCWAVYLGCSWTWCIGMFLPVILVSEFGNIAWFVFAIPNVIGAAAMGWTLARPGASEKVVAEHRTACVAFSAVTIAFHLFFLYWLSFIGLMPVAYAIGAVVFGFFMGFIGRRRIGLDFILGWLVLCFSLTVFGRGLMHPVFGVANPVHADHAGISMVGLAPVCLFGFLFCPYLDITFHRARQATSPGAGKAAFGLGFGVVFFTMIVLTLMYASDFSDRYGYADEFVGSFTKAVFLTWVTLHIAAQIGFTLAAHVRALPAPRKNDALLWIIAAVMVGLAIFAIRQEAFFTVKGYLQMPSGILMYRLFMSFYGLVFPAYVWICMVPIRGKAPGPTRSALAITAVAIVIAAPMFWLGFVNDWMLWLIPAVAVLLAARVFVRYRRSSEPSVSPTVPFSPA